MTERFQIGVIASPHGLKGELKVFPTTDDAKRFKKLKEVMLDTGHEIQTLKISNIKFSGKFVIVKFSGFDRIEDVEKYKGMKLMVDRKDAVELAKNEYFVADLIGMRVVSDDGNDLGEIKDVIHTGANDVYAVTTEDGQEILLPAIKDCILAVDIENRLMRVHLMDGLA